MHQLGTLLQELQSSHDRHWQVARTHYETVFMLWEKLSEKITRRHTLAQSYVDFRHQADQVDWAIWFVCNLNSASFIHSFQLAHGLASIDDVIRYRDNIDLLPESAVKHIEETWSNLRNSYHDMISSSKRIRHVLETVSELNVSVFELEFSSSQESEQLNLQSTDTHRAMFDQCEHLTRKFEQISSSFDGWIRKLGNLRDFKTQWHQFIQDTRQVKDSLDRNRFLTSMNACLVHLAVSVATVKKEIFDSRRSRKSIDLN